MAGLSFGLCRLAFGHGGFAATCSLKAAAILVGPWSFLPQRLKSPCFVYGKEVFCFQVLRLLSCSQWPMNGKTPS
ncbi:hypothetical protein SGRA_3498 [Saprospira grandis str. Lewin]|uniref:Uncharacterized protein n=1 Tax=Saprospira grandis (strain Lewin) TaxID=984262 RepID=H6L058_SAPGL|nr:hypothetical protein SGRA_3498 [Saprospira grandis str. Lewin]